MIDFTVRFVSAPVKSRYFFRGGGWLDLIGIAPIGTFTGDLANTFLAPRSAAIPSDDDDPRAQVKILLSQIDENARKAAELQAKLQKVVALL